MSESAEWLSSWRALAEKELRGASPTSARHDGLAVDPISTRDASRDEGLPDAAAERSLVVVTDRAEDVAIPGQTWWRATHGALAGRTALCEPPGAIGATPSHHGVVFLTHAHEHGASAVTEVALGVVALVRAAEPRIAVAVGPELLIEIAKLRALRRLAYRARGGGAPIWIAARSADRSLARLDVATNAIRTTIGCAAAMIGGADVIGVLPMDATDRGARLARNTGEILARESHLFAVDDPARGSFAIETLTDRIARAAWVVAAEIDRGGPDAARDRIERDAAARRDAVASGDIPIVGVSKYAVEGETCVAPRADDMRDAAQIEAERSAR